MMAKTASIDTLNWANMSQNTPANLSANTSRSDGVETIMLQIDSPMIKAFVSKFGSVFTELFF